MVLVAVAAVVVVAWWYFRGRGATTTGPLSASGTIEAEEVSITAELGGRVRRLLAERGISRFALFLVQQEGKALPGGLEAISGFVLTSGGKVYGFWLDWDDCQGRYVLDPWYQVKQVSEFADDPEYHRARRELGLDAT